VPLPRPTVGTSTGSSPATSPLPSLPTGDVRKLGNRLASIAALLQVLDFHIRLPRAESSRASGWIDSMSNAVAPEHMSADERLSEIAEILAAGLMRLRARQSSSLSADRGEGSLDYPGHQSGHANILTDGGKG
jgi:hypothetical protein